MDKRSIAAKLSGVAARWTARRAVPQPPPASRWSDRIPRLRPASPIQSQGGMSALLSRGQDWAQTAETWVLDTAGRITGRRKQRSRWERATDQARETLETIQERWVMLLGVAGGIGLAVAARLLVPRLSKRNQ